MNNEKMREEFVAWLKKQHHVLNVGFNRDTGKFVLDEDETAWQAWQASRAAFVAAANPACILDLIAEIDALAAQRDERLAREAELRKENESLQERLTEAETMPVYFKDCNFQGFNNDGSGPFVYEHLSNGIKKVVSVRMVGWICQGPVPYTGCADGEEAE